MNRRGQLSPGQEHLFRKVQDASRIRADSAIASASLPSAELGAIEQAHAKLENARIVINLNLHEQVFGAPMIDDLLASQRLYNLFEIVHAKQEVNPANVRMRIMLEFKLFGARVDTQTVLAGMSNTEHPNYGILDYIGDPLASSLLGFYGWYRFVLGKRVRVRSTFTPADSFRVTPGEVFLWEDTDGILATKVSETNLHWYEHVEKGTLPMDDHGGTSYIEAQILGGVHLREDVDMLYYPETDQFNRLFFEKLKRLETEFNIELVPY